MRMETKFVQVPNAPQTINAVNNIAAVWGWTVQSIQVTDSKVSYEGDSYGWVSEYGASITREVITEHTNYASITYQRDMDDSRYKALCAYEEQYNACDEKRYLTADEERVRDELIEAEGVVKRSKWIAGISWMCAVFSFFLAAGNPIFLIATVIFGFAFVMHASKSGKAKKILKNAQVSIHQYNQMDEARRDVERQSIIQQARRV